LFAGLGKILKEHDGRLCDVVQTHALTFCSSLIKMAGYRRISDKTTGILIFSSLKGQQIYYQQV
jgi:hypothetical protein